MRWRPCGHECECRAQSSWFSSSPLCLRVKNPSWGEKRKILVFCWCGRGAILSGMKTNIPSTVWKWSVTGAASPRWHFQSGSRVRWGWLGPSEPPVQSGQGEKLVNTKKGKKNPGLVLPVKLSAAFLPPSRLFLYPEWWDLSPELPADRLLLSSLIYIWPIKRDGAQLYSQEWAKNRHLRTAIRLTFLKKSSWTLLLMRMTTACPFRSCWTPQTTSVHHDRLQFWPTGRHFQMCWRLPLPWATQQGTHQHVILHHVFGVKGANVRLSGLQLHQVALYAAVHSRRL